MRLCACETLTPSPARHEGSPGQVVPQRCFKCGLTCHQARLERESIANVFCCAFAVAGTAARTHASSVVRYKSDPAMQRVSRWDMMNLTFWRHGGLSAIMR